MHFADIIMLSATAFCLIFFIIRAAMSLFYIQKGVKTEAAITNCEKTIIKKSNCIDKEDVTANKYSYSYNVGNVSLKGEIAGLYSEDKFSIGDLIEIRYLSDNPAKSRYYPIKDFMQFEIPFLVIGAALVATVLVRIFVWQMWS